MLKLSRDCKEFSTIEPQFPLQQQQCCRGGGHLHNNRNQHPSDRVLPSHPFEADSTYRLLIHDTTIGSITRLKKWFVMMIKMIV